jgi:hypothetical protein
MTDRKPDRVYGVLVRDARVFLERRGAGLALPGGVFRPMAEDRKVELKAHLFDSFGIVATAVWAQGGFMYQRPGEEDEWFSGFYSVWEWDGEMPEDAGVWLDEDEVAASRLTTSVKILLTSVLNTVAMRTR